MSALSNCFEHTSFLSRKKVFLFRFLSFLHRRPLSSLEIQQAGLHAFPHFNASLLDSLRVPLKTIQERLGLALSASLTLGVYTHSEWPENVEATRRSGEAIEKAMNSVNLTAIQEKGPLGGVQEVLVV
jgi:hypothetical protein